MNEADLRAERTVMARTSRRPISKGANLTPVNGSRRQKQSHSTSLARRVMTTLAALALLVLVLKFFPPGSKNTQVQASPRATQPAPGELHLSEVQISQAPGGEALYLDGLVTNAGNSRVTGAVAELGFHDAQGNLVASVQKPLVGMAHGGTDLIRNEFARNPIEPNEMRFFRIAVEEVPPTWNHEVPELKIVKIKAE